MFGRDPNLPIDHLLSPDSKVEKGTIDDWLEEHQERLSDALQMATLNTEKSATARNKIFNRKTKEAPIRLGTRVFTRNRVSGRNKIQDYWSTTPYNVIGNPQQNVYTVIPADGSGTPKNVTRREILDGRELVQLNDIATDDIPVEFKHPETDDDDDWDTGQVEIIKDKVQTPDPPERPVQPELNPNIPRRTTRVTAGVHSNPYKLPKSAIQSEISIACPSCDNFSNFSQGIAALGSGMGESLGKSLGKSLGESLGNVLKDCWLQNNSLKF